MTNIRRYYLPNSIVFITCVTHRRIDLFDKPENIDLLWRTCSSVKERYPFDLMAYVIIPDHFHWLMAFTEHFYNFSKTIQSLKWNFSLSYKKLHHLENHMTIWQRRFWDHIIRNENDLQIHLDYIHWNSVKHGLVQKPEQWEHSSFIKWLNQGIYPKDWGSDNEPLTIRGKTFE